MPRKPIAISSLTERASRESTLPVVDADVSRSHLPNISSGDWVIASLIAIAALILFAHTWGFAFTSWDDGAYITNNRNLGDVSGLGRIWFSAENEQYYPLTFTTYWIEHHLWGDDPTGYHVVNTVLHAMNALLAFMLARRVGLTRLAAGGVAALFAVHPMQAMSVAWIAERKNLLACLFVLIATLAWIEHRRNERRWTYALALVAFILGLLSKSAIAPMPLVWFALDMTLFDRRVRTCLPAFLPMMGLSIAAVLVTRHFEQGFLDAQALVMIPTPLHRILLATTAIWWYPAKLIAPINLSPVCPLWQIVPSQPAWWIGAGALLIVVAICVRWREQWTPAVKFGVMWFVLLLLPILGLAAYGNLAVSPTSSHYVYIACIGLFIALASILDTWRGRFPSRTRSLAILGCGLLTMAAVNARAQANVFRDSKSLWTAALSRDPACFAARLALGQDALLAKDLPAALDQYSAATRIRPEQYEGYAGLGDVYIRLQQWTEARTNLDRALAIQPNHPPALLHRATVADHDGDLPLALQLVRHADELNPHDPRAPLQVGIMLLRNINLNRVTTAGASINSTTTYSTDPRIAEARDAFGRVMAMRPDDPAGYRGAVECDRLARNWASAITTARAGLAIAPDNVPLKNLLAITLARCPDDRLRDGPKAVQLVEEMRSELRGNFQLMETLASAYGAVGRFDDAALVSREAAKLAANAGNESAARANERWAADYEQHKPRLD